MCTHTHKKNKNKNHTTQFSTHLVTVSLQVVQDITTSLPHVFFAPIYHLLVNVEALLRNSQMHTQNYTENNANLSVEIWSDLKKVNVCFNMNKVTQMKAQ